MANDTRSAELSLKIASQSDLTGAAPKKELAIVSPCSTCQNFIQQSSNSASIDPYQSMCPRRIWIQQQQQNPDNPTTVDPVLYTSGTNSPNTLANPVVFPLNNNAGNYVVWVAAVEDNPGIININTGDVVTPGILDPAFNNLYIKCRLQPYVPEDHHDTLRATGMFQQNDKVMATTGRVPALNPAVTYTQQILPWQQTPVAGTVSKTTFAYAFDTTNPYDHALVAG